MALFDTILNEVLTETKRPDLLEETKREVRAATLKAHRIDYFAADLLETGAQFNPVGPIQQFDIRTIVPRYRALKYIRRVDSVDDSDGKFINIITPEEVLDGYGYSRVDVAYVAGDNINIRSAVDLKFILIGAYQHPDVTELNYNSWIANEFPEAITYEAARNILVKKSDLEAANQLKTLVAEQYLLLKQSKTTDVGY